MATDVHRRLIRWFEASVLRCPEHPALEVGSAAWTYAELDRAANGVAQALRAAGIGPGRRVGLCLPRGATLYIALLGIQKAGASYVPIDCLLPDARRRWLAEDAALDLMLGVLPAEWPGVCWDEAEVTRMAQLGAADRVPLADDADAECYVLYTSGSTGLPKGVPISEGNICAFMTAALPIYDVRATDRVYQGVSLSFDFALEELWPAWAAGATLVASDRTPQPVGEDLGELLRHSRISVLCVVPTVLSSLPASWPELRQLVVSGEACPAELVNRWAKPGIRMLNAYGPTEITVSATIGELRAQQPVTLGHALPHLRLSVRDARLLELPDGEVGELCVAGSGVAYRGYLNRPDQTASRFVPDDDGAGRMYRTGDLVSRMPDGRYLYFGRADDQIKLRGQRIEPGEIESVLLSDPAVANAAVIAWSPPERMAELAAYVHLRSGYRDDPAWRDRLTQRLAEHLPPAMRPSLLDVLPDWPELSNGKTDRRRLPAPSGARLGAVAFAGGDESLDPLGEQIRAVWQRVLAVGHVPATGHFFHELGGHSMTAAVAVSTLRREFGLGRLAVADLYRHPRLADFAMLCGSRATLEREPVALAAKTPIPRRSPWICGLAQLGVLVFMAATWSLPGWIMVRLLGAHAPLDALLLAGATTPLWLLLDALLMPLLAYRVIGRLEPGRYPVWGAVYLKFWIKRKLLQMSPGRLLAGHRWWSAYLRSLGARIGPDGVIASGLIAVPELISLGAGVHIDADGAVLPYEIKDGWLTLAPIAVADDCTIGCGAVLQAGAVLPAGAELAPQSALFGGDQARAGWRHVGNPAQAVAPLPVADSRTRRTPRPALLPLLFLFLLPTVASWPLVLVGLRNLRYGLGIFWLAPLSGVAFGISLALLTIVVVRHCLRRPLPTAIPLDSVDYSRKWLADRVITMHQLLSHAVYDTIFTPILLRALGVKVGKGAELSTVSHFDPSSLTMGDYCFVADLAAAGVPRHAQGHMHIAPTVIGARAFVGNGAILPAGTNLADDTLLGAHSCSEASHIVADCLGVPAFDLQHRDRDETTAARLTFTPPLWRMIGRALCDVMRVSGPVVLFTLGYLVWFRFAIDWRGNAGLGYGLSVLLSLALQVALVAVCVLAKWLVVGRYRPRVAPLWTNFVWRAQWMTGWYEAVALPALLEWLTGTPWLAFFLRGFGCRIGRGVFLDTAFVTEFDLLDIEDGSEVGEASVLQTHLFEDRIMKCGFVHLERNASVGVRSVVLYGGTVGQGTRLDSLSLAMKGERLTEAGRFRGVPAGPTDPTMPVRPSSDGAEEAVRSESLVLAAE
jgi:non-ribosomal peptide synthetase-like protein